jgi:hypothetical protein
MKRRKGERRRKEGKDPGFDVLEGGEKGRG